MTREEAEQEVIGIELECENCGTTCNVYQTECDECGETVDFTWYKEQVEELLEESN